MGINLQGLGSALVIFLVCCIVIYFIFPLDNPKETMHVYNYETNKDEYIPQKSYLAPILICVVAIGLFIWLASLQQQTNITRLRTPQTILKDQGETQELLSKYGITEYSEWKHQQTLGDYTIGHLGFAERTNAQGKSVFMVLLLNHDYDFTTARAQVDSCVLAISSEIYGLLTMKEMLKPSERASLEKKLASVMRAYKQKDGLIQELLADRAKKIVDEEERTPDD